MPLKVTVTMPDFPDDTEIGINGLGVFTNGVAREVTPDEELMYYLNTGVSATEGLAGSDMIKTSGTAQVKDSDLPELPVGEVIIPEPEDATEQGSIPDTTPPPEDTGGGT